MMWGFGWEDWGWGGWLVMSLVMVVFWGLVIAGTVVLVRSLSRGDSRPASGDALRLLDERFARGEMDADEYSRRRRLLNA